VACVSRGSGLPADVVAGGAGRGAAVDLLGVTAVQLLTTLNLSDRGFQRAISSRGRCITRTSGGRAADNTAVS
jgi:hypothetical protein